LIGSPVNDADGRRMDEESLVVGAVDVVVVIVVIVVVFEENEAEAMGLLDVTIFFNVVDHDEDWRKGFRPKHRKADRNIFNSTTTVHCHQHNSSWWCACDSVWYWITS
jgi:hypothetical protein